jgi:LmbE family N-acetylglucosaminyl deacetylase
MHPFKRALTAAVLACSFCHASPARAAPPDERYKADILLFLAHPDDETLVSGFLARCALDRHKRVAVVYGTRGEAGGNGVGTEQAGALSAIREIEARRALSAWGIDRVWFLEGQDTASQNVLRSLSRWHHGQALGDLVRLVRLTRPEVVLTMLPDYSTGENHGDHQAAGVLATEAFDAAGDPTIFPEQVASPANPAGGGSLTEGLRLWQPQKLYYFSETDHPESLEGRGPVYPTREISPTRRLPYYKLSAEEWKLHRTQNDVAGVATLAETSGDWKAMLDPERLVLGKSLVPLKRPTDDVFTGVSTTPVAYAPAPGYHPSELTSLQLGGPWGFYRDFWKAHGVAHLETLWAPESAVTEGSIFLVPLVIRNLESHATQATLRVELPAGWSLAADLPASIPIRDHQAEPLQVRLHAPAGPENAWQTLTFESSEARVSLRVRLTKRAGLPQESLTR